ncbi:MAG TPA: trypsin-like peptidase domain-containing protein [Trebonia sp.]|nr:trypsin-like peptidase domain-containing protein [Trebonia sp.]
MRYRVLTLSAAALAVAAVPAGVPAHDGAISAPRQRTATRYWTQARMKAAIPASSAAKTATAPGTRDAWLDGDSGGRGLRWVHGGAVERTAGKVFFTLNGTDYVCSGTAIRSPRADVVLTAAHCVGDDADWAANWTFVPGYRDGSQPYGAFTARRFFVSRQWRDAGTDSPQAEQYDIAFVTVNSATASGAAAGVPAPRLPSGLPVAFTSAPDTGMRAYVFGYPAEPPFTGLYSNYCAGPAAPGQLDGTVALRCDMTAGDSGGPWLAGFDPRAGTGTVVAITTFKYGGDSSVLYATRLGPAARQLYDEASAVPDP